MRVDDVLVIDEWHANDGSTEYTVDLTFTAGAHTVVLSSPSGLGVIRDTPGEIPVLEIAALYCSDVDLVLAEGYKQEALPKIEIFRSTVHAEPLSLPGEDLLAMVSDVALDRDIPRFGLAETRQLAKFLLERFLQGFKS